MSESSGQQAKLLLIYTLIRTTHHTMKRHLYLMILAFGAQAQSNHITHHNSQTDLPHFQVSHPQLDYQVFHDAKLQAVAEQAVPHLTNIYLAIANWSGVAADQVSWSELALVTDANYIPPREDGTVRWSVVVDAQQGLNRAVEKNCTISFPMNKPMPYKR